MLRPLNLGPGLIFDGRSVMVSLCALFFGPWAGGIAGLTTIATRIGLGGAGTLTGILVILSSVGIGLLARLYFKPEERPPSATGLYGFGLAVHLAMLALMFTLPGQAGVTVLGRIGLPVILLYPLATILAGKILSDQVEAGRQMENLKESTARYDALAAVIPVGVYVFWIRANGSMEFEYVSPRWCAIHQVSREAVLSDASIANSLVHPEEREAFLARNREAWERREPFLWEGRFVITGEIRWLRIQSTPNLMESRDTRWFGVTEDITDRKRAEESLRLSEAASNALLNATSDAAFMVDLNGALLTLNEETARRFGRTSEELLGRCIYDIMPEDVAAGRKALVDEVIRTGRPVRFEDERSGMYIHNSIFPIFDESGKVIQMAVFGRDVTEARRAEKEGEKLQGQLHQAQKMEAVGRLAGGVAHDFNNMLAVILAHTEMAMLEMDPLDPLYERFRQIQQTADRSANLVRQLLAFARKQPVDPLVLDLNDAVTSMLKMLGRLIGEDIHLAWIPGSDLWPVTMDPSQIDQILVNLCVNARDAIVGVGKITIETGNVLVDGDYCAHRAECVPGRYVLLSVSDNGCGMGNEVLEKLFEPFFTTKEEGRGTGLGLATVYGIVRQNKGFINVYSEPGQGTTFKVYLPRHEGKAEGIVRQNATKGLRGGHETILLVEDEPMLLEIAKSMLERLGYRVLTAEMPSNALQTAKEYTDAIHLLMTDMIMPGMNGRELSERLLSLYPRLKCLFMSGYTSDVIAHHGVLEPGVPFIQKPFTLQTLSAKLREMLEEV